VAVVRRLVIVRPVVVVWPGAIVWLGAIIRRVVVVWPVVTARRVATASMLAVGAWRHRSRHSAPLSCFILPPGLFCRLMPFRAWFYAASLGRRGLCRFSVEFGKDVLLPCPQAVTFGGCLSPAEFPLPAAPGQDRAGLSGTYEACRRRCR
jgi:hypothetical protein